MTTPATGSHAVEEQKSSDDRTTKESLLGNARPWARSNVSWGAIIAGVFTFLALTVLLAMASGALGLGDASGAATGIFTVIALAIALAAAGWVTGALATRSGLLHGFLTWAVSIIAIVVLAGWLGSSLLGTLGSLAGSVAGAVDPGAAAGAAGAAAEAVDPAQADQAAQQAQQGLSQAADATSSGLWWGFAGTLIGAVIATVTGGAGARSVQGRKDKEIDTVA